MLLQRRLQQLSAQDLAGPAVVFAPHQDDETLGCGGTIVKMRQADAEVGLVFVADGGTSHEKLMAPERMAAVREGEARAAARELGLADADVTFLRYPNRRVHEHEAEAVAAVREILAVRRPATVFVPYVREPPADHRATRRVALAALRELGEPTTVYEYPIWFWEHLPWMPATVYGPRSRWPAVKHGLRSSAASIRDFRHGVAIADVLDRKRAALAHHVSQMQRQQNDPRWSILADVAGGAFLERFFGGYEFFLRYTV